MNASGLSLLFGDADSALSTVQGTAALLNTVGLNGTSPPAPSSASASQAAQAAAAVFREQLLNIIATAASISNPTPERLLSISSAVSAVVDTSASGAATVITPKAQSTALSILSTVSSSGTLVLLSTANFVASALSSLATSTPLILRQPPPAPPSGPPPAPTAVLQAPMAPFSAPPPPPTPAPAPPLPAAPGATALSSQMALLQSVMGVAESLSNSLFTQLTVAGEDATVVNSRLIHLSTTYATSSNDSSLVTSGISSSTSSSCSLAAGSGASLAAANTSINCAAFFDPLPIEIFSFIPQPPAAPPPPLLTTRPTVGAAGLFGIPPPLPPPAGSNAVHSGNASSSYGDSGYGNASSSDINYSYFAANSTQEVPAAYVKPTRTLRAEFLALGFSPYEVGANSSTPVVPAMTRLRLRLADALSPTNVSLDVVLNISRLASPITFSTPAAVVNSTNGSSSAGPALGGPRRPACVYWDEAAAAWSTAGCAALPSPVPPRGAGSNATVVDWIPGFSGAAGGSGNGSVVAAGAASLRTIAALGWAVTGPLMDGCTVSYIDCASVLPGTRVFLTPDNPFLEPSALCPTAGTPPLLRFFLGAECALSVGANNSVGCWWSASDQAFEGPACEYPAATRCACIHLTDFSSLSLPRVNN